MSKEAEVFQALMNMSDWSLEVLMDIYESGKVSREDTKLAIEAMLALAED